MDKWSREHHPLSFVLSLGDNFYKRGVKSVYDKQWKTTWEDVYLTYPSLKVPWQATLGNHDYKGNVQAQISFTTHKNNPDGLWRLPSKCYVFRHVTPSGATVDFFGIDTNGAHISVRKKMPHMENELHENKKWLAESLTASDATWKIVFAHHPLYTKSRDHGCEGRRIRDPEYVHYKFGAGQGYALEDVLVEGHVDAYFAGICQVTSMFSNTILHVVFIILCVEAPEYRKSVFMAEKIKQRNSRGTTKHVTNMAL